MNSLCAHSNRADSRLAPSQWETPLQSNAVSHWLGANLESTLLKCYSGVCFLRFDELWSNSWNIHQNKTPLQSINYHSYTNTSMRTALVMVWCIVIYFDLSKFREGNVKQCQLSGPGFWNRVNSLRPVCNHTVYENIISRWKYLREWNGQLFLCRCDQMHSYYFIEDKSGLADQDLWWYHTTNILLQRLKG